MRSLKKRLEVLEGSEPETAYGQVFLWCHGQPLDDALAHAGLTLDDKPLLAIRLTAVTSGEDGKPVDVPDQLYERDRHLVE